MENFQSELERTIVGNLPSLEIVKPLELFI